MPAVSVANPLELPRVAEPVATLDRPVRSVTTAPIGYEGEGFMVRRAFAGVDLADLDPFVHLDQMGEVEYGPGEPLGTPWHPHRGFETVTYMIDGQMQHQDSHGGGGLISDGDTQWMTAGSGILHIETPPEQLVVSGGLFHGFQLWVNLPRADKWLDPKYQDLASEDVTLLTSPDGGALLRLIAGDIDGHAGPGRTHTDITLIHATIQPGARITLPWRSDFNALGYILNGDATFGPDAVAAGMGQLVVWGSGNAITIKAGERQESRSPAVDVLLLGGRPIREPVAWYGPFVMNTKAEVQQAFDDYQAGRLGSIPHGALGTVRPTN
ncbi:pirin family protein [Actinomycetota bacterium]